MIPSRKGRNVPSEVERFGKTARACGWRQPSGPCDVEWRKQNRAM